MEIFEAGEGIVDRYEQTISNQGELKEDSVGKAVFRVDHGKYNSHFYADWVCILLSIVTGQFCSLCFEVKIPIPSILADLALVAWENSHYRLTSHIVLAYQTRPEN